MDDVRAVMDAAGSARAALFGFSEGRPMSGLFAATYPERTTALIMHGSFPRRTRRADYPWGPTDEEWAALVDQAEREWRGSVWFEARAPHAPRTESSASGGHARSGWGRARRRSGGSSRCTRRSTSGTCSAIRVPTLILHSVGDLALPVEGSRWMAGGPPWARARPGPGDRLVR
jgi:pimeloyl-ACP methyl ester carboxylesterase